MARGKSLCLCALSVSVLLAQTSNETAQNLNDAPPSSTAFTEDANSTPSLTNGFLSENDTSLGEINTLQAPAELAPSTLQSASARAITIPTGVDLQTYLNNAQPGDTLILPAGAVFTGNFTLPNKIGSEWITITSSRIADLPAGTRVKPSQASLMPKIVSPNGAAALDAAPGSHNYRIVGIQITPKAGMFNNGLLRVGNGDEKSLSLLPHDFEIDRVYIHGDPTVGSKRGIALNGIRVTVKNSYISGFKSDWQDTQAICGWNGPGPFSIVNNYLEAAGENVFFAEGSVIANVWPSNILISRNHIAKLLAWRTQLAPSGSKWAIKNLIEFKSAKHVVVDGNIIENNWLAAQTGFAVVVKAGTDSKATVAATEDITFTNNIFRHATGAIVIQGKNGKGGYAKRINVRNNLFDDINSNWGASNGLFLAAPATDGLVFEHNTATSNVQTKGLFVADQGTGAGFVFRSNIGPRGSIGVKGSGLGEGTATLNALFPGWKFTANVIFGAGGSVSLYPYGTYMPLTAPDVGFLSNTVWALTSTSPYNNIGHDGLDIGVNWNTLMSATSKSISGLP
jgi:hypothetical protein